MCYGVVCRSCGAEAASLNASHIRSMNMKLDRSSVDNGSRDCDQATDSAIDVQVGNPS